MVCPFLTAELRVSSTVEPEVAMLEMVAAEPSTSMVKSETEAVVEESASL